MNAKEKERQEAFSKLRELVKPGDALYTILRHRSRSGMLRVIDVVKIEDGNPTCLSFYAAKALGWTADRDRGGVKVSGCGMDMGFHLIYELSSALFPQGFDCIGEGCPSNDHSNRPYPKREAGSLHHKSGGYALHQRWL